MSRLKCGCVYADAKNTPSVRSGHEMGGYLKQACPLHGVLHEESGKSADELWLETGRLRAQLADKDDLIARLRRQVDALVEANTDSEGNPR